MDARLRRFDFEGLSIETEVVEEQAVDGGHAYLIQSRCGSQSTTNWNTCMAGVSEVESAIASAQQSFARQFAKELRGIPTPSYFAVGLRFFSAKTGSWSGVVLANVDPDQEITLVSTSLVDSGHFTATGKCREVRDRFGHTFVGEVFQTRIKYGDFEFEQEVCALELGDGPSCIAGQDIVAFMRGMGARAYYQFLDHDVSRVYREALRHRGKSVLLIGPFNDDGRSRLDDLQQRLFEHGYRGILLDDFPDASDQSLDQKLTFLASLCKFVICLDASPAGHYLELEICARFGLVTAVWSGMPNGELSTAMLSDIFLKNQYAKLFAGDIERAMGDILSWADQMISKKAADYASVYKWRSN